MLRDVRDVADSWVRSWRTGVGWLGVLFIGALSLMAAAHFLVDSWQVVLRLDSMAALRVLLVALAVLAGGLVWTVVVARLATTGQRGHLTATVVGLATLVAVRVVIAFAYDGVLSGEPGVYDRQAADLVAGMCCPWDQPIDRPPGYAFLLAGAYAVLGRSAAAGEALNIAFAVATGLVIWELARGLYGPRTAAVALLLYALWPAGALMTTVRIPHSAYDLAFAAAAWTVVASPRGWRGSALGGTLLGLSQYLRPTTFALLPAFIVARVWQAKDWRGEILATVAPMLLTFLLVLVPIMAWHDSTRGVLDISTSAYGGSSLYHGTNIASGGRWSERASRELTELAGHEQWERTRVGQQLAIGRLRDDPVGIIGLAIRKQDALWGKESYGIRYGIRRELASEPWQPRSVLPTLASGGFYAALLGLTALGLYLRRRRTDALTALVVVAALTMSLMHGLVEVRDRYHAYLVPLLMPIAAYALTILVERLPWPSRERGAATGTGTFTDSSSGQP
jgi:4-amino-4-deoxy-L-arabinose transferase-like glycosyltransferase